MNEQLSNKLLERYPLIFKDYGGDPMKTCMAFGIECGSGWFWIIDALCANIVNSYENAVGSGSMILKRVRFRLTKNWTRLCVRMRRKSKRSLVD